MGGVHVPVMLLRLSPSEPTRPQAPLTPPTAHPRLPPPPMSPSLIANSNPQLI